MRLRAVLVAVAGCLSPAAHRLWRMVKEHPGKWGPALLILIVVSVYVKRILPATFDDIPLDCLRVCVDLNDASACKAFEAQPLDSYKDCFGRRRIVPRIYHAVAGTLEPPRTVLLNSQMNPEYHLSYQNDSSAAAYVREFCGREAAQAYHCFRAPAYRADVFRFCALFAAGGLYIDTDIITLKPFDELYLPCRNATMGHDIPPSGGTIHDEQYTASKQMKILAAAPRAAVFRCMLKRVIEGVRSRTVPNHPLDLSGPVGLQACYAETAPDNALTYLDTHRAAWPYSGLRTRDDLLAYEMPNRAQHLKGDDKQVRLCTWRGTFACRCRAVCYSGRGRVPSASSSLASAPAPRPLHGRTTSRAGEGKGRRSRRRTWPRNMP